MIDVESLSFFYVSELTGDRVEALRGADVSIRSGTLALVRGSSGYGKSTLMRALTGLVPQMAPGELDGVVRIDGRDFTEVPLTEVGYLCSSVFQNPRTQFLCNTVSEEFAFCGKNYGRDREALIEDNARAAELMGISHLIDRKLSSLSGGQLQKVALACALVSGTPVLLTDEPTSNSDPDAIADVRRALAILKEQGMAIVIVEHRLRFLRGLADQVLPMEGGKVTRAWSGEESYAMDDTHRQSLGLRTLVDPGPSGVWVPSRNSDKEASYEGGVRLSCRDLSFSYGNTPVFNGLNADFPAGQIIYIAGMNDVGKTTLVRVLCGLAAPGSGTITLDGWATSRRQRQAACALVMQDTGRQLLSDTLTGELTIGASEASGEDTDKLLGDFDLAHLEDRHPLSLSGDQKQRLVIAVARITGHRVVILDEPTSGVNARHLISITSTLRRTADEDAAVIVVTHDGEFASACADRLITLTPTGALYALEGDHQ